MLLRPADYQRSLTFYRDEIGLATYRDYRHGSKKELTLSALEFIRRFSLHILPPGLVRIRHYGILGNNRRKRDIEAAPATFQRCKRAPFLRERNQQHCEGDRRGGAKETCKTLGTQRISHCGESRNECAAHKETQDVFEHHRAFWLRRNTFRIDIHCIPASVQVPEPPGTEGSRYVATTGNGARPLFQDRRAYPN